MIKRLILPNPESELAKFYFDSVEQDHARLNIRSTTAKAVKNNIEVRWCDHFPFHSITIVDPAEPSGWAYVENALPYYATEERPGYTISRQRQREAMTNLIEMFEKTWKNSRSPDFERVPTAAKPLPDRILIEEAARIAYEAAEREGVLDLITSPQSPPEVRLNHFKYVFLSDDEVILHGVRPPSTQALPIVRSEDDVDLAPVAGESSLAQLTPYKILYVNVTISKNDLDRIIRAYPEEAKTSFKGIRR